MSKKKIAVYMRRDKYNSYGFEKPLPDNAFYKSAIEKGGGEFAGLYFDYSHEKDRPSLRQMLVDYFEGKIDQINIKNISRLADIWGLLQEFEKTDICVYFESENIHTGSETFEKIRPLLERRHVV